MMNIITRINKLGLKPQGGLYRPLQLFTLSCICRGYNDQIRKIAGLTYGPIGAFGDGHGWKTVMDINKVINQISIILAKDKLWLRNIRQRSIKELRIFKKTLDKQEGNTQVEPMEFIRFIIEAYPKYLAIIGTYNLFMRYLEYANNKHEPFPRVNLYQLGLERDKVAKIYPHCERLIAISLKRISKKHDYKGVNLSMLNRTEIKTLLKNRITALSNEIKKREKGFIYLYTPEHEYIETKRSLVIIAKHMWTDDVKNNAEVHGRSVFTGKCQGTVIKSLNRNKWPDSPIYLATMTNTNEKSFAKRLKAIVTDEGGVLCHAAIMAREFHIPCIVGTKVATKVFKDGDRVEVDADKGSVRKI